MSDPRPHNYEAAVRRFAELNHIPARRLSEIAVMHDWRWEVANWPMSRWLAWRRRSAELQPASPSGAEIRQADHAAYLELMAAR